MGTDNHGQDRDKRLAAQAAAAEVCDGMLVGLGSGSTAAYAIRAIAAFDRRIEAVATSEASADLARRLGIVLREFNDVATLDLTIDGVDEIDTTFRAIKGAGGAMLREKVVACASRRMVVVADGSKQVTAIGAAPVPVEVLPFARAFAERQLSGLIEGGIWRDGYRTDNGNAVIDCRIGAYTDWHALDAALIAIPGVVGHGLFLNEIDAAYIATQGVVTRLERGHGSR